MYMHNKGALLLFLHKSIHPSLLFHVLSAFPVKKPLLVRCFPCAINEGLHCIKLSIAVKLWLQIFKMCNSRTWLQKSICSCSSMFCLLLMYTWVRNYYARIDNTIIVIVKWKLMLEICNIMNTYGLLFNLSRKGFWFNTAYIQRILFFGMNDLWHTILWLTN
jgi:hypothetical protein